MEVLLPSQTSGLDDAPLQLAWQGRLRLFFVAAEADVGEKDIGRRFGDREWEEQGYIREGSFLVELMVVGQDME